MILVTGGNGCVGERLAAALRRRGRAVRVLGLAPSPADEALRALGVEVLYGDVTRAGDLDAASRGAEAVIHLAAVLASSENPGRYREVNVQGTRFALDAAARAGASRFVFVSSISVTYPRRNAYSASKAEAEEWVRRSGIPWTIVRPCLVLGAAEHAAFSRAVARWPILPLPRGGAARKRPLTSEALAEGLAGLACEEAPAAGKTLSLAGSETVTLREMADSLRGPGRAGARVWPVPEALLRAAATSAEWISRITGKRLLLTHQSVDGLVYDAVPEDAA